MTSATHDRFVRFSSFAVGVRRGARYRLEVRTPPGFAFASGYGDERTGDAATLDSPALGVFGPVQIHRMHGLQIAVAPGQYPLDDRLVLRWASDAADAVAGYFGGPPAPGALVLLLPCRHDDDLHAGYALGYSGGASVRVHVGKDTSPQDLAGDWRLTHELIHLAFPNIRGHQWLEEGLATYLEPIARARLGKVSPEQFWSEAIDGLSNALDGDDRMGFEDPQWGDIYWGGALFLLRTDVAIRGRTQGKRSIDDALIGIHRSGDIRTSINGREFMKAADRLTAGSELSELYGDLADSKVAFDLSALLRQLGVSKSSRGVRFDDTAPMARVRKELTAPRAL